MIGAFANISASVKFVRLYRMKYIIINLHNSGAVKLE